MVLRQLAGTTSAAVSAGGSVAGDANGADHQQPGHELSLACLTLAIADDGDEIVAVRQGSRRSSHYDERVTRCFVSGRRVRLAPITLDRLS